MEYIVDGGRKLHGEIEVYGAKNCALALLGATVLTKDAVTLKNCPEIADVENMLALLVSMGKKIVRENDTVTVWGELTTICAPRNIATLLRGSALVLGSTVAKYGKIALPLPGGCAIGARPMDIHIDGLRALGVETMIDDEMVSCCGAPEGTNYKLRFASVGATENMLCACALAKGTSRLYNCATEPEVVALEQMLVQMGATIYGVGGSDLIIVGTDELHGTEFDIIPDRIVTATYLSATVATLGDVTVTKCVPQHLDAFLSVLSPHFCVKKYDDAVKLNAMRPASGYGDVSTAPYPGFPTDMQSLLLSLACVAEGTTLIEEKLFENRLMHNATELSRMGADIAVSENIATVKGRKLHPAVVTAKDLRGGAGLVIATLSANGKSTVKGVEHINRGYSDLAQNLCKLGAKITLVD